MSKSAGFDCDEAAIPDLEIMREAGGRRWMISGSRTRSM